MVVVIFRFATNDICGWFDEREACTKKLRRRWHHGPNTTISQNPGGGGGRIQGPGPATPPWLVMQNGSNLRLHPGHLKWVILSWSLNVLKL